MCAFVSASFVTKTTIMVVWLEVYTRTLGRFVELVTLKVTKKRWCNNGFSTTTESHIKCGQYPHKMQHKVNTPYKKITKSKQCLSEPSLTHA